MARILLIETSTAQLSAALAEDGKVLQERICTEARMQASLTAPYVRDVLSASGCSLKDCDAVCVGKGPGSYTGLRVGVSTAKGLCFGASLPLGQFASLFAEDILVQGARGKGLSEGVRAVVPMIDARRMEVYSAVFTPDGQQLTPTRPVVVEEDSFSDILSEGPVLFIGDGAMKCRSVLSHGNARFAEAFPNQYSIQPFCLIH